MTNLGLGQPYGRTTLLLAVSLSLVCFVGSFPAVAAAPAMETGKSISKPTGLQSAAKAIDSDPSEQAAFLHALQEGDYGKAKELMVAHGASGLEDAQIRFVGSTGPTMSTNRGHCKTTTTIRTLKRSDGSSEVEVTSTTTCG